MTTESSPEAPPQVDAELQAQFVQAMGLIATGVTVVGSAGATDRVAQTVSAMCSVSAEPPFVLVCIHARSPINEALAANGVFCVSALATQHDHVADTFAGRPWPGKERWDFTCGHWESAPSGSPRLTDALSSFDCDVHQTINAGSHLIYIGAVRDVHLGEGAPLVYANRAYSEARPVQPSTFPDFPEAHPDNRTHNASGKATP